MEHVVKIASLLSRIAASPDNLHDMLVRASTGVGDAVRNPLAARGYADFGDEMGDKAKDLTSTVLSPLDVPYHLKHVITGNPDPKRSRPGHAYYAAKGGLTGYGGYALVDRNIPEVREIATNEDTTLQGKLRALMALR